MDVVTQTSRWAISTKQSSSLFHYTLPDVLFFLSGIWIPQILQAPQKDIHIKEDIQRSLVPWEKFPHKLLQGASMNQINSRKKGEQVKEWQKERTIQILCIISFPPFRKWNSESDFDRVSKATSGLGSRAAQSVSARKDDCRHPGEDIWDGRMWWMSEGVFRRDKCSEMQQLLQNRHFWR